MPVLFRCLSSTVVVLPYTVSLQSLSASACGLQLQEKGSGEQVSSSI